MVTALRAMSATRRDFVHNALDIKNALGTVKRAAVLEAVNKFLPEVRPR